jgi:hypothetical protein
MPAIRRENDGTCAGEQYKRSWGPEHQVECEAPELKASRIESDGRCHEA